MSESQSSPENLLQPSTGAVQEIRDAAVLALQLKGMINRAVYKASVVTALLTTLLVFGWSALMGGSALADRIDHGVKALVCILSVPPEIRTLDDTSFCLLASGIDPTQVPIPPRSYPLED